MLDETDYVIGAPLAAQPPETEGCYPEGEAANIFLHSIRCMVCLLFVRSFGAHVRGGGTFQ